jgi:hypothetical protein
MENGMKVCWRCGAMQHRVKGVTLDRKRQRFRVRVNGTFYGRFKQFSDAIEAARIARLLLMGRKETSS